MSRRRQRIKSSGGAVRIRQKDTRVPEPWTVRDRVVLFGAFAAVLLVYIAVPVSQSVMMERRIVSERIAYWRLRFHLSESEVQRLHQIEFAFHGSGFPSVQRKKSRQQIADHKRDLSGAMGPKAALDFIKHHESRNPCGR